jgi:hypothetical protein
MLRSFHLLEGTLNTELTKNKNRELQCSIETIFYIMTLTHSEQAHLITIPECDGRKEEISFLK